MQTSAAQQAELDKFERLAQQWWDPKGPLHTLHDINPIRLDYVARACHLNKAKVADIGCGAGILSEALAKHGAQVSAIDLASDLIEAAKAHSKDLNIDYQCISSSQLAQQQNGQFDVVTCMEMLEHVDSPAGVIADCAQLLKPGGHLFLSTINRTPKAWAMAIVGAEYVLNLLPRGTHSYQKFIQPSELADWSQAAGLEVQSIDGMRYNPVTKSASIEARPDVNYLMHLTKKESL